jgi:deoxycytidine triphosphate deaminase
LILSPPNSWRYYLNLKSQALLTDREIKRERDAGNIVIEPFDLRCLSTNSYDARLGPWFYRETDQEEDAIYNPRDQTSVVRTWGNPQYAMRAGDWMTTQRKKLVNIHPDELIIWIGPGESILCATQEFIGFRRNGVTSMQARSSIGRSFLVVCSCAGKLLFFDKHPQMIVVTELTKVRISVCVCDVRLGR